MLKNKTKNYMILISVLLILLAGGIATIAYLLDKTDNVENVFDPTVVTTEVKEDFDGTYKKNVTAKNTGDIDAFIRMKLISYRVNDKEEQIGGTTEIPAFTLGDGWFKKGEYYYYSSKVKPEETIAVSLVAGNGIELVEYTDVDGGKQVIEVMAEAIQADGVDSTTKKAPAETAWGVKVTNGTISAN